VRYSVLQSVVVCCRVLQSAAVFCSVLQFALGCCIVSIPCVVRVVAWEEAPLRPLFDIFACVSVRSSCVCARVRVCACQCVCVLLVRTFAYESQTYIYTQPIPRGSEIFSKLFF